MPAPREEAREYEPYCGESKLLFLRQKVCIYLIVAEGHCELLKIWLAAC